MVKRQAKTASRNDAQRRFLGLVRVGNQTSDNIDEGVDWAAMASVFNLRNIR